MLRERDVHVGLAPYHLLPSAFLGRILQPRCGDVAESVAEDWSGAKGSWDKIRGRLQRQLLYSRKANTIRCIQTHPFIPTIGKDNEVFRSPGTSPRHEAVSG